METPRLAATRGFWWKYVSLRINNRDFIWLNMDLTGYIINQCLGASENGYYTPRIWPLQEGKRINHGILRVFLTNLCLWASTAVLTEMGRKWSPAVPTFTMECDPIPFQLACSVLSKIGDHHRVVRINATAILVLQTSHIYPGWSWLSLDALQQLLEIR